MIEGVLAGLDAVLTINTLLWVVCGCIAGTVIGMIPGLGPITAIALMIPISYSLDPASGLVMMAGVYYGAVFGGSTSAILINAPGVASTVATSFDGYPMAREGKAGKALAIAAYASFIGGTLGAVGLALFAGALAAVAIGVQSAEYSLLLLIALASVVVFAARGEQVTTLASLLIGLIAGTIGTDQLAGVQRFTFGRLDLADGLPFILLVMGTFALAEGLRLVVSGDAHPTQRVGLKDLVVPAAEARQLAPVVARSSVLGFLVGVLPGAGATLASLFAWDVEKRIGSGSREAGLAAPEAANNAACTGSFVPLLTLGIPGSGTTAVLLGVMLSYGLQPGPTLITDQPVLFWTVIVSMYVGNIVLLVLNLPLIPWLARLINVQPAVLIPLICAFSVLGVYLTTFNPFDIALLALIGGVAALLRASGFPLAPVLLGFILSGMFEENVRRTLYLAASEDSVIDFLLARPVACALLLILMLLVVYAVKASTRASAKPAKRVQL